MAEFKECPTCKGSGHIYHAFTPKTLCNDCKGSGLVKVSK